MTGEVSATSDATIASLPSMDVTSGDRIFVSAQSIITLNVQTAYQGTRIDKSSGTATIVFNNSQTYIHTTSTGDSSTLNGTYSNHIAGIVQVTGSGTLVLRSVIYGTYDTITSNEIYAFFLKKQ
jgi:hypothetical protein